MSESEANQHRAQLHRDLERRVVGHLVGLVGERSFVVPTTLGPKPAALFQPRLARWNQAGLVKKAMVAARSVDFSLQDAMPVGEGLDVSLGRQVLLAFRQPVGHVRFASLPAWDDLAAGREARPMSSDDVRRRVGDLPPPGDKETPAEQFGGPMTLILFAGGGFTPDARRVAREFTDGPPTILIEPNDAGGFTMTGPPGARTLLAMLDPESGDERQARVEIELERRKVELLTGAVALDRVAEAVSLPVELVAAAATRWAQRTGDALRVKTVDGVPMLYPDASATPGDASQASLSSGTLSTMDRVRRMFGGSVSAQRRLAELAEQRAALSRQRDRQYDEMSTLEERERELRDGFAAETSTGARRRITSQLVQLQKDLDRRRETVGVLNKQINVVGTHLHNLELARTGTAGGKLPTVDELANDAARAEEVLADLEVTSELADELAGGAGATGLSDEEEQLFQQLTADAEAKRTAAASHASSDEDVPAFAREIPVARPKAQPAPVQDELPDEPEPAEPAQPQRSAPEAEPG